MSLDPFGFLCLPPNFQDDDVKNDDVKNYAGSNFVGQPSQSETSSNIAEHILDTRHCG
ncbi:hypothetical protein CCP2SC5_160045 [Azospirillaceae bacterium]